MSKEDGRIAGHLFIETPGVGGVCACGRTWIDIAGTTSEDLNKDGIAHYGNLTTIEYQEIVVERDRVYNNAMGHRRPSARVEADNGTD